MKILRFRRTRIITLEDGRIVRDQEVLAHEYLCNHYKQNNETEQGKNDRDDIIVLNPATAMISAVITLGISLQRYMYDYAVETDGNWHVAAKGLSEEQVKEFQENEE